MKERTWPAGQVLSFACVGPWFGRPHPTRRTAKRFGFGQACPARINQTSSPLLPPARASAWPSRPPLRKANQRLAPGPLTSVPDGHLSTLSQAAPTSGAKYTPSLAKPSGAYAREATATTAPSEFTSGPPW